MMRFAGLTLALTILCPSVSTAHRLDEYLQATRIALDRDRITVDVDLTPGSRIASDIVALIDGNQDGQITAPEAETYGWTVLTDVVMMLDGRPLPLMLNAVAVPAVADMADGMGTIHVKASAIVAKGTTSGHRRLYYRNNHEPGRSVYLVNALMPGTDAITIARQRRDDRQRELRLDYDTASGNIALMWTAAAALILATLTAARGGLYSA